MLGCIELDTMAFEGREIGALIEENTGFEDNNFEAILFRFHVARRQVIRERAFGTFIENVGRKLAIVA